ncbi:MAG: PAS domain S-box protein [Chloroflexaceae bacterium]
MNPSVENLHTEIKALHQRVAELEARLTACEQEKARLSQTSAGQQEQAAALERRLTLYQALARHFPNGTVALFDHELRFLIADGSQMAVSGLTAADMEGRTIGEIFDPETCAMLEPEYRAVLAGNATMFEVARGEAQYEVHAMPIRDDQDNIIAGLVVTQNITTRKQMEAEIRASETWFRQLTESLFDGWAIYEQGYTIEVNQKFAAMLGYEREELIGTFVLQIVAPESHELVKHNALTGYEQPYPATLTRKDGTTFPAEILGKMRDYRGRRVRITTIRDITERRRHEEEQQKLVALIENSSEFIGMSSFEGQVLYLNEAGHRLSGIAPDTDIKRISVADFLLPEVLADFQARALATTLDHGQWTGEVLFRNMQTGDIIPMHQSIFLIRDSYTGEPTALGTTARDLTEQKRAENERAALQEEVIAAQRLALRELSTPLIPISDEAVVMPLIGAIDSARVQQIMETLLEGITAHQADVAILDITGVQVVDTQVADALLRTALAVKLLGAQVVLTGISPVMAQTLIHLGADLSMIVTRSNLQEGIAYALNGE